MAREATNTDAPFAERADAPRHSLPTGTVRTLGTAVPRVPVETSVSEIDGMFRMDLALRAVAVENGPHGLTLLTRRVMDMHLSGRLGYGRSLLARHNAGQVLPGDDVVFRPEMTLDEAAELVLGRPEAVRYDDLLMIGDDGPRAVGVSEIFEELAWSFRHAAWHDDLTGLPNRRWLAEQGPALLAQSDPQRTAILYIDLDNFKAVNDTHGHDVGNLVLVEFARRMRDCLRLQDAAVRLGGDEFVGLLFGIDEADAQNVGQRVLGAAVDPIPHGEHLLQMSATIGLAMARDITWDEELGPLDVLLRHADGAMLAGKRLGKHRVQRIEVGENDPFARLAQIRRRLQQVCGDGALGLVYEPVLDLESGECVAVRAVLTWQDPELGTVAPEEFIPIAERTGVLGAITGWYIERACAQAAAWCREGHRLPVAVGVAPGWILGETMLSDVLDALTSHGIGGECLRIDVAGRFALEDAEEVRPRLTLLRDAGAGILLDGYGGEHAPASLLRALPFTAVNLAPALTDHIDSNESDVAIVEGIVQTAHALGLDVHVSEAARPEQLQRLRALGCDGARGPVIAEPLEADEVVARVRTVSIDPDPPHVACV